MTNSEQSPQRPEWNRWGRIIVVVTVLTVLPFAYLFTVGNLNTIRGPLWLGTNSDPSYPYLLNSLLLVNGQPPFLIEHPGTTAQIGGAIVLRARAPFTSAAQITQEVLTDPESAVAAIVKTYDLVTAAALLGFGLVVWRLSKDLLLVLLFQGAILFFRQTYLAAIFFAPELFFPPLCLALGAAVIAGMYNPESTIWAAITGLLTGVCLMLKLTFLPFVVLGLFVFRPVRLKVWYVAMMLVTLAAYLYLIRSELPRAWLWVSNLVTHSGRYGGGPREVIDWASYFPTLLRFLWDDVPYVPLLLTGPFISLLSLRTRTFKEILRDPVNRVLCILSVLEAGCFVMTAKHPASHYLVPVVAIAPLHLFLAGKALEVAFPWFGLRATVLAIGLGAGLLSGASQYRQQTTRLASNVRDQIDATEEFAARLNDARRAGAVTPVYYYRTSSLEYSLLFGNGYSRSYFSTTLARLYPTTWFFNIFNARFQDFTEMITGDEFYRQHPNPLFFGSNSIEAMPFGLQFPLPPNSNLRRLWQNPQASIHEIQPR